MKVFITGITGFIGRHLCEYWKEDSSIELSGCGRAAERSGNLPDAVTYHTLDIAHAGDVLATLKKNAPAVVIHAAAMSRPNDCELEKAGCWQTNVEATKYIADACKQTGARLLFLSTDMVYADNGPYSEEDTTCAVNYYGESKVAAEQVVMNAGINYAIVRTVLVYGKKLPGLKNSFLQWVHEQINQQKNIRVFTDQFRTATYVNDLCAGISTLVNNQEQGIFHLCGNTIYTPYEIANFVADYHQIDKNLIQPVTNNDMQEAALRPSNCTLKIEKAQKILGYKTTPIVKAIQEVFS